MLINIQIKKKLYNILASIFNVSYFKYISILTSDESHRNGGTVVDLGCGDGHMIASIARLFPKKMCIGIDLIQKKHNHNNASSSLNPPNLSYLNCDIFEYIS